MSIRSRFPHADIRIKSPGELAELLAVLREVVDSGALVELEPSDAPGSIRLSRIPTDGPWPDLLDLRFAAPGGGRFRLRVETFHGAGGSWFGENRSDGEVDA